MDIPRFGIPEKLADRMSMAEQHEYLRSRLTRRGVLRTSVATAAVAGAGLGTSLTASPAYAAPTMLTSHSTTRVDGSLVAPFGRHLAYGADPRTQMAVSWQVPFAVRRPYIRIGLKPWALSRKIDAEVRHLTTPRLNDGKIAAAEQFYVHAGLERLKPGTTYYYGVGHDGFDPADTRNLGTLGTFTTAPPRAGNFTFTAFGDQGVSYHALGNDQLILGQNPAFHLHAGDICYADPSGSGQTSDTYDARTWDQFLAQTETVSKTVPWMVTTGNHDMEAWYSPDGYGGQNARWTLPDNGPDPVNQPGAYSFVHGNVGVIALDANDVSYEIPANFGISGGRQTRWLDRRLGELRARHDIDFLVVFFHHCASPRPTHTPRTAAYGTPGCRSSRSTRWTWSSTVTTTFTSAPTRSSRTASSARCRSASAPTRSGTASCTSPRAARARRSTTSRHRTATRDTSRTWRA